MKTKLLNWRETTLDKIFIFEKKSTIKAGEGNENGKYKFFTSSDTQSKFIDKAIFDGEHLIFSTGGQAGIHYCNERFSTSTDCFVVKIKETVNAKYLYYFLRANIHILEAGFKGAGLKHISKEYLKKVQVTYPEDKTIQEKIVSILEKAEKLKEMRKEADELTDDFLKSVFLEMFGDPTANPCKWKVTDLASICKRITDGTHQPPKFVPAGIPFLFVSNIVKGKIDFSTKNFISHKTYEELTRTKPIEINDILYSTVGSYGVAVLVNTDRKFAFQRHIGHIKPNEELVNPIFLQTLLNTTFIMNQAHKHARGVAQKTLNLSEIRKFRIILPPKDLQNKFAFIVKEIERFMEYQKQSREHIHNLFNNMMQESFKGELAC